MNDFTPAAWPILTVAADDARITHHLGANVTDAASVRVVIAGFPTDEGVRRNGGRVGAAASPDRIRNWLGRLTPDARCHDAFVHLLNHTLDLGNLNVSGDLAADQERFGHALAGYLVHGVNVIVLGGGHETAFGHFLGYVRSHRPVSILNWDAHADVRPLIDGHGHSGSPFRQALEHSSKAGRTYTVAGLNPSSTAKSHLDWLKSHHGQAVFADELNSAKVHQLYHGLTGPAMVSFDLDAVVAAAAPGVSAPGMPGLPVDMWLAAAEMAGRSKAVQSIDVVELNPIFDIDDRTARLAARTVWSFLSGLARRT
jgi:formiminoglutamase